MRIFSEIPARAVSKVATYWSWNSKTHDQRTIDQLQRDLDAIEKRTPMIDNYARIDPEIIETEQAGTKFRFIIYHRESKAWFGQTNRDAAVEGAAKVIRDDEVVFDLGCNSGYHTAWFAVRCAKGRVYSFDPYPWNAAATRAQAVLNRCSNVTVYPIGIGESDRSIEVDQTSSKTFNAELRPDHRMLIEVQKPDYFRDHNPTFLKIDIEGAEQEIARSTILSWPSVKRGYVEMHTRFIECAGEDPRLFLRRLEREGFSIHFCDPSGCPVNPATETVKETAYFFSRLS